MAQEISGDRCNSTDSLTERPPANKGLGAAMISIAKIKSERDLIFELEP
jgi:hypothetical protein